jgi:hypothetical protein
VQEMSVNPICTTEVEGRRVSEPIYCPAVTYRATRDTPRELCETEVAEEGDLCSTHDADARMDDDYDRYLEAKEDR